jgi:hypothetical protein
VNTKRTVALSSPGLVRIPFKVATPAVKGWLTRLAKAEPDTTPDPPIWVTVTSHLISDGILGAVSVFRLKLTLPPLHIVAAEVSVRVIVGVGSTTTSIGARATPAQLEVP